MNSATWVSLPGGLLVSMRMSALSSSLVSRSTSATTAGSMPAMSSTPGPPVLLGDGAVRAIISGRRARPLPAPPPPAFEPVAGAV